MELLTRKVWIAGIASSPAGLWMIQAGRNLTDAVDGLLNGKRYLIHDRDPLFTVRVQSGLLVDYRACELIDNRTWIHLPIVRTARTSVGLPRTERSIFRTLRAQENQEIARFVPARVGFSHVH